MTFRGVRASYTFQLNFPPKLKFSVDWLAVSRNEMVAGLPLLSSEGEGWIWTCHPPVSFWFLAANNSSRLSTEEEEIYKAFKFWQIIAVGIHSANRFGVRTLGRGFLSVGVISYKERGRLALSLLLSRWPGCQEQSRRLAVGALSQNNCGGMEPVPCQCSPLLDI